MFFRTYESERENRLQKRRIEIQLILNEIDKYLDKNRKKTINILEFGCGNGFQIPYLEKIGNVIATDIFVSKENVINRRKIVECDIKESPFKSKQFDIIFSNHVIEHISDVNKALDEIKRIGNDDCLYVISVPTNYWLLLSIPAQYLQKIRSIFRKFNSNTKNGNKIVDNDEFFKKDISKFSSLFEKITPHGHGVIRSFWLCYNAFKKDSWLELFKSQGFKDVLVKPLLLYAPSEFPIIPLMLPKGKFSSSILYILIKE